MKRSYLLVAAPLLAALACGDLTYPNAASESGPPELITLVGTIVVEARFGVAEIYLKQSSDDLIHLTGREADLLTSVDGADVWVRGEWAGEGPPQAIWNLPASLYVESFLVVGVGGRAALDGVVAEGDDGVVVLLLTGGGTQALDDPPADLMALRGRRIWLIGSGEDLPMMFGEIGNRNEHDARTESRRRLATRASPSSGRRFF